MVGFISPKDDNNSTKGSIQESKPKSSIDSNWSCNFDLDHWPPELDDLSLPLSDSLLDFDSIQDWIEEMQGPFGVELEPKPETCITDDFRAGRDWRKDPKKIESNRDIDSVVVKGKGDRDGDGDGVADGNIVGGVINELNTVQVKTEIPDGIKVEHAESENDTAISIKIPCEETLDPAIPIKIPCEETLDPAIPIKIQCEETLNSAGEELGVEESRSLTCSVEEGIGKVSLTDNVDNTCIEEKGSKSEDDDQSVSTSDSDDESSSSSSSSSSSRYEEGANIVMEDRAEIEEKRDGSIEAAVMEADVFKGQEELEEGEIVESDRDEIVESDRDEIVENGRDENIQSDADEDIQSNVDEIVESDAGVMTVWNEDNDDSEEEVFLEESKGPIRSKNELQVLPPVPPVDITLQPSHQMLAVGYVSSILGTQVIVEGAEKHDPLSEGSILWITQSRSPLGRVDDIFGPVKNPFYIVRYNSESEVPSSISQGTLVSFVSEFVDHVINEKSLYQKGYDASEENDEEAMDEAEFSDDEKEAEYRRMMKFSKRGNDDQKPGGNMRKKDKCRKNGKPPFKNTTNSCNPGSNRQSDQQHLGTFHRVGLPAQDLQHGSSGTTPIVPFGHGAVQAFTRPPQQLLGLNTCGTQPGLSGMNHILPSGHGGLQPFHELHQQLSANPSCRGAPNLDNPTNHPVGLNIYQTQPGSSGMNPILPSGLDALQALLRFPQNGFGMNVPPFQQCNNNMAFSSGFQANGISWMQQQQPLSQQGQTLQSYAMPMMNAAAQPFQHSVGPDQSMNMVTPFGASNPNPNINPCLSLSSARQSSPNMLNQAHFAMGFNVQLPQHSLMTPGTFQSGSPCGQSGNMQQMTTGFSGRSDVSPSLMFNQGARSSGQGGKRPPQNRGRGGRHSRGGRRGQHYQ